MARNQVTSFEKLQQQTPLVRSMPTRLLLVVEMETVPVQQFVVTKLRLYTMFKEAAPHLH
jgi:hypothetical protein